MHISNHVSAICIRVILGTICGLLTISGAAAERRYVVRKNDTLTGIARKHGLSVGALTRYNRLTRVNRIFPGDILRIPDSVRKPPSSALDSVLEAKLDNVRVAARKWRYIVVHHSATDGGNAQGMDRYHREERHMENGLAYHFLIGNGNGMQDGEIAVGRRWLEQLNGGHLASESLNEESIGICLVGNFDSKRPSTRQMASLGALVEHLMRRCHLERSALKTHQQINPIHTRCPGRLFPSKDFLRLAKKI